MRIQIIDNQPVTDAHGAPDPLPLPDATATTTAQPSGLTDPTTQRLQDAMVQLLRQGVDISLRSLQVWADLARQFGLTALGSSASATYDEFEKLLEAQCKVVNELVAIQRQLVQEFFDTTSSAHRMS